MDVVINRAQPVTPPVSGVTITLSQAEAQTLYLVLDKAYNTFVIHQLLIDACRPDLNESGTDAGVTTINQLKRKLQSI